MNPITRLRLLCLTAFGSFSVAAGLLVLHGRSEEWVAIFFSLFFSLIPVVGVCALSRVARLLFPMSLPFQFALTGGGYLVGVPMATPVPLLGFCVSIIIIVLLFTSPTKQLFIPRDPDAPVL